MKKTYLPVSLVLFCFFLSITGCKDKSTNPPENIPVTVKTSVSGTVLDESNSPISGAKVSVSGQSDIFTDAGGNFLYSNIDVPKDRFVVNVSKSGYFTGSAANEPVENGTINVRIYLVSAGVTQTVDASTGGEANTSNGSGVMLNPNSIANADGSDYSGNVNVSVAYLDPTSENFSNLIPGGDMLAQKSDNSQATLYSYGIIKVALNDDAGNELNIKNGNQSEITVDIPPDMVSSAPSTISLWYYDKSTGLWKEEGTATKQGDKYVGNVSHFSDWNCDTPEGTATVHGLVTDCHNAPVPGINVKIGQASAITGSDGTFERRVPANTAFQVQVLGSMNFGLSSSPVDVPPLTEGTIHDVGTLNIDCPAYVQGLIKCGTEIKYGQVVISWDGGFNSQFTDAQGGFRLATDIGKDAQLSIYTFDGKYKNMEISTPANRGDSLDLGIIEVCESITTGDNEFTIDGSGFSNRTFTFNSDTSFVYGYYSSSDSSTFIWMNQVFGQDTITFWLSFKGTGLGTGTDVYMYLFHNSNIYYAYQGLAGTSTSVNVTLYSGLGGLIEGTFSGTLQLLLSSQTVTITNGKFSVVRIIGKRFLKDISKLKFPDEIKDKMKNLK